MRFTMPTPTATYRLQFHKGFTFNQARELIPYLARLGISDVYASPIFRAAPGSTHGYDVCDHNALNPELGTRDDFEAFSTQLKVHGLGLIMDFVPNHMGIDQALNPWWRDVLENGPSSAFATHFDIDWKPLKRELENKVLLPVLGEQYGRALEDGGFRIEFSDGHFVVCHEDLRLPLSLQTTQPLLRSVVKRLSPAPLELESIVTAIDHLPRCSETAPERITEGVRERQIIHERLVRICAEMPEVADAIRQEVIVWNDPEDAEHFDLLDELLSKQAYRLSSWRVAGEEINYRRFFDVNTLAAIRIELPEVFDATHRLLFELVDNGHITGVRIDHIDGLAAPQGYLTRLRSRCGDECHILVEKILGSDEMLRTDWPVQGTTGYEFANQVIQLLVPTSSFKQLSEIYARFLGFSLDYREVSYRSKKLVMESSLSSEVNVLGQMLNRISESQRWYRDFTVNALTSVVKEVIACFPVYRTYLDPGQAAADSDIQIIRRALNLAKRRNPATERTVFEFLRDVLLPPKDNAHPVNEELRRSFVIKFQQCTGPITAKGLEDTAFYVFNRLVALNEVGGDPSSVGLSLEAFHRQNSTRLADFPQCMLATSTHDTKRSEDVRARQAAIAEIPEDWGRAVRRWQVMNRKHRSDFDGEPAPDANEEYLIYQTLIGAWPMEGLNDSCRADFIERIQEYMVKALHEAKVNSSWLEPNAAWDEAVKRFIAAILTPDRRNRFLQSFAPIADNIAMLGAINSLTQIVLKLTCPGVPDFYQGSEMWDFSLVDPDNRRPVDFPHRKLSLDELADLGAAHLLENWRDGRIKMFTVHRLLNLRHEQPELFSQGSYTGRMATGVWNDKIVAFERRTDKSAILVIAPRHTAQLGFPATGEVWADTHLDLPKDSLWRDIFTGLEHTCERLQMTQALQVLPFAVLIQIE